MRVTLADKTGLFTVLLQLVKLFRIPHEKRVGKNLEVGNCYIFQGIIPAITWRERKKHENLNQDS
jgi:hypothetical protein